MSRAMDYTEDDDKSSREETRNESDGGSKLAGRAPSFFGRLGEFYHNVKLEMRKTSWPTRNEVWSTTIVVLIAVIFFGFYLWGIDLLITLGFEGLEKTIK